MDPRASFLGEIALVGADSPIFGSGLLFDDVILDENAASHIALGFGYTPTIEGGVEMTDDELMENGCNRGMLHLDFMIGSADMDVTGRTADGTEMPIMHDGVFVI
jgi:aminopeptidase